MGRSTSSVWMTLRWKGRRRTCFALLERPDRNTRICACFLWDILAFLEPSYLPKTCPPQRVEVLLPENMGSQQKTYRGSSQTVSTIAKSCMKKNPTSIALLACLAIVTDSVGSLCLSLFCLLDPFKNPFSGRLKSRCLASVRLALRESGRWCC